MENTFWIFSNIDSDGYEYTTRKAAEKGVARLWRNYSKGELPGMLWVILQTSGGNAYIYLDGEKYYRLSQSTVDLTLPSQSFKDRAELISWLQKKQFKFLEGRADKSGRSKVAPEIAGGN